VTDYNGLIAALRARMAELNTTFAAVDHVAGFNQSYASKVLAPSQIKTIGKKTLPLILGALGVRLQLVVDEVALVKIRRRLTESKWPAGRRAAHRSKLMEAIVAVEQDADAQRRALMSELGRQSHTARMARTTPEVRQQQASVAANARWKAARRRLREAAARSSQQGECAHV
jgi:hypothetical protein